MRTTKQLLKILRENLRYLHGSGLCYLTSEIWRHGRITDAERSLLRTYINENRPNKRKDFSWRPGVISPRYIWLTKQIWKLRHES